MSHPYQDLSEVRSVDYGVWEVALGFVWRAVWFTVWKIAWHRIFCLRAGILRAFGAKVSLRTQYFGNTWIQRPWEFSCGRNTTIGPGVLIYNLGGVRIGENTLISQRAHLCGGTHDWRQADLPLVKSAIRVGDGVWICAEAFVGPNVVIGDGSIVGARAVVVKNVAPMIVVAGNPARFIKQRIMA